MRRATTARRTGGGRPPLPLAVPAVVAVGLLLLPLAGVLARTPWSELGAHLTSRDVTQAIGLSLVVSFWSLGLSLVLGVPLAWLLARTDFPGKALVRSLVLLPMVLPPTVGGVALLMAFGRRGLIGAWLEDALGVTLPFSTAGAVVAATFVSMPFLVISLEGTLAGLHRRYEETAASLGASPVRVFATVTLPLVAPGLAAGAALTWARALGEFGATITFAGNLPGVTQTLPLQVYLLLQSRPEAATSVSLLLLAIAMLVLLGLRGRWATGPREGRAGGRAPERPERWERGAPAWGEGGAPERWERGVPAQGESGVPAREAHGRARRRGGAAQAEPDAPASPALVDAASTAAGDAASTANVDAEPSAPVDAGPSASADAVPTAPVDAGPSASADAVPTAPVDAGPSANVDAEPSALGDAGPPEPADAAPREPGGAAPAAAPAHPAAERAHPAAERVPGETWPLHAEVEGYPRLALDAQAGSTIAVVGPNGAGKTTLLRALLGLTPRAYATVLRTGGEDDARGDEKTGHADAARLPPHRRGVAWVPQDGALFPHLSALNNTAYGLRAHRVPRTEARRAARQWLDRLGVGHLAHRRPGQLSGGQAGRVALARALATRPRLLLLDEPLAALDQSTRAHVRHTLREHLAGFGGVCLIVTHDPVEAVSLADRVLVLEDGRLVQDAHPTDLTRAPRSPWVARMLGRNAWPGTADADGLALHGGGHVVAADPLPPGTDALAVVGPEAVSLHRDRPSGSPRNVWHGRTREITALGSRLRVLVATDELPGVVAEITPAAAADLGLTEHSPVWLSVKATEVRLVEL